MEVIIDQKSGFCFGVERAIKIVEEQVTQNGMIYCLGDIVHNSEEINRLKRKGIVFISRDEFQKLSDCKVMIRAHGEPPETFKEAKKRNIDLIDATCPVVIKLQDRIRKLQGVNESAQIVIFGRNDHPEIVGLKGQVDGAVIIESIEELGLIDFKKPVYLFAQTTKDREHYAAIKNEIIRRLQAAGLSEVDLIAANSICGQAANRASWLTQFSRTVDLVVFVGGKSSSNSRVLFDVCRRVNKNSFFVTSAVEVNTISIDFSIKRIGVCGATSTPYWLLEKVANGLRVIIKNIDK